MKPVVSAFRRNVLALALLLFPRRRRARHSGVGRRPGVRAAARAIALRLLVRVPLGAMRDVEFPLRGDGLLDLPRADRSLRDAATLWLANDIAVYEGDTPLGAAARSPPCACRCRPIDRSSRFEAALAQRHRAAACRRTRRSYWNQALLDVLLEYPIASDRSAFSIRPALARLGVPRRHRRCATSRRPARSARSSYGDPGLVRLDPRWHQAAWRFVHARVRPHPRRHRPPAVPVLPGDSVPPVPRAGPDRDRVHHRALDHADRGRVRPRARRAVVPAARRDADRGVDPLHGAREHRRRRPSVQRRWMLAFALRARARLRVLVRAARDAAVRRLAPA